MSSQKASANLCSDGSAQGKGEGESVGLVEGSLLSRWLRGKADPETGPSILLLDGGVSTHLEHKIRRRRRKEAGGRAGEDDGPVFSHRELWSSSLLLTEEGHDFIRDCHEDFLRAGADMVETVTYQAHYMPLVRKSPGNGENAAGKDGSAMPPLRLDEGVVDGMLRDGVRLAREAARKVRSEDQGEERPMYVAASIGCYGGALADGSEYTGNYGLSVEELRNFHGRKASILASESPDILAFETVPCIIECQAILEVLQELHAATSDPTVPPAWLSLACCDGEHLNDGSDIKDALEAIEALDPQAQLIQAVGINCCACDHVPSLLGLVARHIAEKGMKRAIVCYPNSGEEWDAANETWVKNTGITSPSKFAEAIASYVSIVNSIWEAACKDHGTKDQRLQAPLIVGGCCRTSPETIAAIKRQIHS